MIDNTGFRYYAAERYDLRPMPTPVFYMGSVDEPKTERPSAEEINEYIQASDTYANAAVEGFFVAINLIARIAQMATANQGATIDQAVYKHMDDFKAFMHKRKVFEEALVRHQEAKEAVTPKGSR